MKKCKKLFAMIMSMILLCGCGIGASDADTTDVETTTTGSVIETTAITTTEKKTTTTTNEQVQFSGFDPETNYDFEFDKIVFSIPKNWEIESDDTVDYLGAQSVWFKNNKNSSKLNFTSMAKGTTPILDYAKALLDGCEIADTKETRINGLSAVYACGSSKYLSRYITVYLTDDKKMITVELEERNDNQVLFKEDYLKITQNAVVKGNTAQTTKLKSAQSSDIRPEFKQMIDEYEAFFNSYVAFMKRYEESGTLEMVTEYLDMLGKLNAYQEKLDAVEDMEMNAAEQEYYTQAVLRINKKMLEVSLSW